MDYVYDKKNVTNVLFLCFILASLAAGGPKIEFDKEIFHGTKADGSLKPFFFEVRNTGDEDLVIKSVTSSCGCTDIEVKDSIVPPGSTTKIEGGYATNPDQEAYHIRILVVSNASNAPQKLLAIAGRNIPEGFKISPMRMELVSIEGKKLEKQKIQLSVGEGTIEIIDYNILRDAEESNEKNEKLFYISEDPKINKEKNNIVLNLYVNPPLVIGKYKSFLNIDVLVNGERITYRLPLVLEVAPRFYITPDSIQLTPYHMASESYNYRALLRNREAGEFIIKSVSSSSKAVTISTKKMATGAWFLYFNIIKDNELYRDGATASIVLDIEGVEEKITYNIAPLIQN